MSENEYNKSYHRFLDTLTSLSLEKHSPEASFTRNLVSNHAPDQFCYVFDLNERHILFCHGIQDVLGYREEDFTFNFMISKNYIHPDDFAQVFDFTGAVLRFSKKYPLALAKSCFSFIYRVKNNLGDYRCILNQTQAMRVDSSGKLIYGISRVTDIEDLHHFDGVEIEFYTHDQHNQDFIDLLTGQNNNKLTLREKEIINLLMEGLNSREIAEKLDRSVHTVNTIRNHVLRKTGKNNTASLIRFVQKMRWL